MARLPEDEIKRRLAENVERFRMTEEEALERWPDDTPEKRAHRKTMAEHQAARYNTIVDDETGQRMMGGFQPRTQISPQTIMEEVAALANSERKKEVVDALFSPLSPKENAAVRGKGAERIVRIAQEQVEIERRDREELRKLGKDELVERLAEGLMKSDIAAGLFQKMLEKQKVPESPSYDATSTAIEEAA